jgi:RimJ/RimL family protein N-acetyltransferase
VTDPGVRLRPFRAPDLELLTRFATDPAVSEPFQWYGFTPPDAFRRRWEQDGFLDKDPRYLIVAVQSDDTGIGWVMWRNGILGAQALPGVWEIGALLFPEHRGRGAGTAAQRLLVEYLFTTTAAHRIWAGTEAENIAEQRALEKCGFQREGCLRGALFRGGQWHDELIYGMLRSEQQSVA